ncbi:unnamed protein product [Phytophthora lilii]|uniref:Unnamed protein product n=1 Tax=Phytophthora lilii TaxID=2077276 RepID=A0A9W6TPW6_9STRA|nr:unnamed protein product [Phytophthora lilii]
MNNPAQNAAQKFCNNKVTTAKYTKLNFIPRFFYGRLSQVANFYFLLVGAGQIIPEISSTQTIPYQWIVLMLVLSIDTVFAAIEDRGRHIADAKMNARVSHIFDMNEPDCFRDDTWRNVAVGDIIKVENYESIPADRNNSPGEDFCLVIFENLITPGVTAREVFDAFIDVAQNSEIVMSEIFGSVTIREDSEADSRDISQMRLFSLLILTRAVMHSASSLRYVLITTATILADTNRPNCDIMITTKNKTKAKKTHFKLKATAYEVRKERKRGLAEQVKRMQQELDSLKFQVHGEVDKTNKRVQAENKVLQEFIQQQQLTFARMHAALAVHALLSWGSLQPAQSLTCLGTDREARHRTLVALKGHKLEYAKYYLLARNQGFNPASSYCQEERVHKRDGHYCVTRFEASTIRGATAKEVFDAVLGTILNAEIFLSEMCGSISVREDNELKTSEFAQIRLASSISSGEIVESNTVLFSNYTDGPESGHGVIATDFVDSDRLYPYRTGGRVRLDTSTLILVRSFSEAMQQTGYSKQFGTLDAAQRPDVVITRWTSSKIHASKKNGSPDPERDLRESSSHRKGLCLQDRALQKAAQVEQLAQALEPALAEAQDARSRSRDKQRAAQTLLQTNGRFPFAREKLRGVLRKHGIEIVTASREADEELGDLVRSGQAFAVLAEDSDFLIMRGVKYIPFDKLSFYEEEQETKVCAKVFSSEKVAESLGLEVDQLVDLAILCGNDFTPVLDSEYDMATVLDFPVQRRQAASSLYPADAARWVADHMPTLENPFLSQIEADKKGFLRALFEIYRFYGHKEAFLKKFPMKIEPVLPYKKIKLYKKLIDRFDYPPMAIDILETQARGLSQRFDPLPTVPGLEDKSLDELQAPVRRLSYLVLDTPVVREVAVDKTVEVHVTPLDCVRSFVSTPVQGRSARAVDRMLRSLVFVLLYQDPNGGTPKAGQLAGMLGKTDKRGLAVKNIVYALLILWKRDRTYLSNAPLLDERLLELLLLASLVSLAVDSSKQKQEPKETVSFDEQQLNMETYAAVAGYLETLKQLHQLRLVMGNKLPQNSGCATFFSGEVFVRVCHIIMLHNGKSNARTKKNLKTTPGFSRKEIELVVQAFPDISNSNLFFWTHFAYVRATMQRMKALIVLPAEVARTAVVGKSAAISALESAMIKSTISGSSSSDAVVATPHPDFAPPLPPDSPPHLHASAPAFEPVSAATKTMSNQQESGQFTPPLPPGPPTELHASAPAFNPRTVKGLMPSSVAKKLGTDSAANQGGASDRESKKPVSLKGLMKTLPVFAHREEILQNVEDNQLTIIQGETGCGKSTSVPQFLYDSWARDRAASERPVNIYVTQPRRIAAIELANTVARMREGNEFDEDGQVGKVIGYRIGQKQMTSSKTKITYVTTGYMVERIIHDPEALDKITHLVLDEVHERSMDVDLLLLLLKLQLKDHPHLRLVIMSATMDAQILIKYLGKALSTRLVNRKPLFVGSKLFPVKNVHLDEFSAWFPSLWRRCQKELGLMTGQFQLLSDGRLNANSQMAKKAISKIHEKQLVVIEEMVRLLIEGLRNQTGSQCILIFLPGIGSINSLYDSLSVLAMNEGSQNVRVLVLHSGIELENQQEAFKLLGDRSTKIILSTNIAESSVTIPDVTHVINCAIEKQIEMPNAGSSHAEVLVDTWCSRASALQRSGRAGRVMPGTAFHLFTESFRDRCMAEYNTPELLRKPLDRIVLQLKGRLNEFGVPSALLRQALDAPDLSHIDGAYKLLSSFDAIDSEEEEDSRLTRFGSFVCHLPLSLELCRLLMTGAYMVQDNTSKGESWSLLLNTVVLVAILAVPDLFVMPSFYHAQSAQTYVKEMKKNLQAKLKLDDGMWSEPLSVWLFYIKTMSEQPLNTKRNLGGAFHKLSISFRRFQTLNFLISDLCARLISLSKSKTSEFEQLLDAKTIVMLGKLDAYASSQKVDKQLLKFARDTVGGKRNEVRILRFLVVQNYGDHLIGSTRAKPTKFADDDLDGTDRVDLKVDREEAGMFLSLSNREKATLFNQLASTSNPMDELAALAHENNIVSIYSYATPRNQELDEAGGNCFCDLTKDTVSRMSFPVSLVYYIRGEKFPVNLGTRPNPDEQELAFKFRVSGSNSCALAWQQLRDNVKASTGNRSLFSLPIRPLKTKLKKGAKEAKLLAVYADRLFTGDETRMWCTNCTLLPPNSVCYYPMMLLVTAPRHANIQLHMDAEAGEILLVKVGAQDAVFPRKMALKIEVLATINSVRAALSDALNATVGARRLCVSDLLALSDDSVFVTKESKANAKKCKWQRLAMNEQDKSMLAEGETPARFPELYMV